MANTLSTPTLASAAAARIGQPRLAAQPESDAGDTSSRGIASSSHAKSTASGTDGSASRASSGLRRNPASSTSASTTTIPIFARALGQCGRNASREARSTKSATSGRAISA